ncbi:MAG: putative metal-binding motif-containing protein [Polyangiales bacterium]
MRGRASRSWAALLFLLGCSASEPTELVDDVDPDTVDASACPPGVDVEAELLRPRCATVGCHSARSNTASLDLETVGVAARLSGRVASTCPDRVLVVPGDPSASFVVQKLGPSPACGRRMPDGAQPLSVDEVACVRAWVLALAPRDAGAPDGGADAALTPCAASDTDGDGYGTHASCAQRDCDDRNLAIHPGATEACNGVDDDCDGEVDDGFGEGTCGMGACRRTVPYCREGRLQACAPMEPTAEVCNGLDDDCDGSVDEGAPGMACGVGRCRREVACAGGRLPACTPGQPAAEVCNGEDDDCDGVVDDGLRASTVGTTYTELSTRHDGCTQATRSGPECNAAISRFCAGRGCATTGFGPLENSGDTAAVGCVRATVRETTYSALVRSQEGCTGSSQRVGPECNAAIHRWCASRGFATGYGPVENSGDVAVVTCVRP